MPFEPELLRFIIGFLIARFNFLRVASCLVIPGLVKA
jgi:hypothetical protein